MPQDDTGKGWTHIYSMKVRSQKSEAICQKSEVRSKKLEVRSQKTEVGSQKSGERSSL